MSTIIASPGCSTVCPIDKSYLATANCNREQSAGAETKVYVWGYCQTETVTLDTTAAVLDFIKNIELASGQTAVVFDLKEKSIGLTVEGGLNENYNLIEKDTLVGQGLNVDETGFRAVRQFKGKEVVVLVVRNDGIAMCAGWNGGLRLMKWKYDTGKDKQKDFHGFDFEFVNDTREGARIVKPDVGLYPGGIDDLIASLT